MRALKIGTTGKRNGELFQVFGSTRDGDHCLRFLASGRTETISDGLAEALICKGEIVGTVRVRSPDVHLLAIEQDLSSFKPEDIAEGHRRKEYCDAILRAGRPSPQWHVFPRIIDEVALARQDEERPHWKTVADWLRTYVAHNCDFRCLIPLHGRKGRRKRDYEKRQWALIVDAMTYWLDGEDDTRERPTLRAAHQRLRDSFEDAAREVPGASTWKAPHEGTFQRLIDVIPEEERVRRREGEHAARAMFEHGDDGVRATYPLEIVEIDDTWDNHMVCNDERTLVLGRPYITLAIDKCTRMFLGMHISFDAPSTATALACLKNAVFPKTWLLEEFPHLGPWPAYGPPVTIVVDNGSAYISDHFRDVCAMAGVTRRIAPVNNPEFKGGIERAIGTMARQLRLPGAAGTNPDARGKPNPEAAACLTLSDLREAILNYLINEYAVNWHTGIADVPLLRWQKLTKDFAPALPTGLEFAGAFGELYEATLTKTGLVFQYLEYRSAYLKQLFRKLGPGHKLAFRVVTTDLCQIHVIDPESKQLVAVRVRPADEEYAKGLSLYEHKLLIARMRAERKNWEDSETRREYRRRYRKTLRNILARAGIKERRRGAKILSPGVTTPSPADTHSSADHEDPVTPSDEPFDDSDDDAAEAPSPEADLIELTVRT